MPKPIILVSISAFILPIVFVLMTSVGGGDASTTKSQGTLIYFYSPS